MKRLLLAIAALAALAPSAYAFSPDTPNLPDDLVPTWNALKTKKGTPEYLKFIATRNYVEACQRDSENPPAKPKDRGNKDLFAWAYVGDGEVSTVSDAIVNYLINHPTAKA